MFYVVVVASFDGNMWIVSQSNEFAIFISVKNSNIDRSIINAVTFAISNRYNGLKLVDVLVHIDVCNTSFPFIMHSNSYEHTNIHG